MRPADLHLDLDSFDGPFDLLCTILLRRELPLFDVQLAEVVVGYVQRLSTLKSVDPDTASEFLLLLASLMEIKARELLAVDDPLEIDVPAEAEGQHELLARLIQYSAFRNAAAWMGRRGARPRYWREASRPVIRRQKTYDGPVLDPALLHRAMGVLLAQPDVDVRHLVGKHASVHDMTQRFLQVLHARRKFTLDEAVEGMSRLDQAVAFVAVLELCKHGQVDLVQTDEFGPIHVQVHEVEAGSDGDANPSMDGSTTTETEFQIA